MRGVRTSASIIPASSASPPSKELDRSRWKPFLRSLLRAWMRVQVSRSGQYSLARLHEFHDYPSHTTPLRCVLVCLFTPLPSLLFVVFLECLPLDDPTNWKTDLTIWLRMACTTSIMGFSYALQFNQVVSELSLSPLRAMAIGVCSSIMYLLFLYLLGHCWTFPIPFGFVVTAPPYTVFIISSFLAFVGLTALREIPQIQSKLFQLAKILTVQSMLVYVYPVYTAVFMWLDASHQPVFLMCLPVIKLAAKNLMARACVGTTLQDQTAEITVFSVELFNSLYLTACFSIAGSAQSAAYVIMTIDVVQSVLNTRAILARARRAVIRHRQLKNPVEEREEPRGPMVPLEVLRRHTLSQKQAATATEFLDMTCKLHFSCEYIILVEYIECFIPLLCLIYTAVLTRLPNVKYYPHMHALHGRGLHTTLSSLAVYAALEIVSLAVLSWILWRKLHVRALFQLAFVLEKHMLMIQAKLFVWVTYSLTFRLVHSGMDFEKTAALLGR